MTARDKIISVAKSYMGAVGGSKAHSDILYYFNSVKPDGYTAHKSDPWCSEFVSACAIQAFGKKTAKEYFPLSAACTYVINKAKKMDIWVENDAYTPKKADWILYDWDDNGKGDNKGQPDHVGIVEKVSNGKITVIEGNCGNKVARRTISVNGKYIRGFVTPHYEKITVDSVPVKSIDEVTKEVLSGKWGTGAKRKQALINAGYDYDAVQKRVNDVVKLTNETLDNKYGVGRERVKKLGKNYDIVQWNINRLLK